MESPVHRMAHLARGTLAPALQVSCRADTGAATGSRVEPCVCVCVCVCVSRVPQNYSAWFARAEHGMHQSATNDEWRPFRNVLTAASLPPPDLSHHVWNFGCTLFNLRLHRTRRVAAAYQRVAAALLARGVVGVDTLFYGLGVAYLVYQSRVACYDGAAGDAINSAAARALLHAPSIGDRGRELGARTSGRGEATAGLGAATNPFAVGWSQLDGLGHIPHHEMKALVGTERIETAAVLHYTGERKPWSVNAFNEYAALLPPDARPPTPPPMEIVLLLHDGPSTDLVHNLSKGWCAYLLRSQHDLPTTEHATSIDDDVASPPCHR